MTCNSLNTHFRTQFENIIETSHIIECVFILTSFSHEVYIITGYTTYYIILKKNKNKKIPMGRFNGASDSASLQPELYMGVYVAFPHRVHLQWNSVFRGKKQAEQQRTKWNNADFLFVFAF